MKPLLILASTLIVILSSCSSKLTPYTERLNENYRWTDSQLKNIQFYLSEDIVLWRDLGSSKTRVSNGQIKIIDGRKVEQIVFKKGTPGVFVFSPSGDKFAISFEDSNDKFLMFGPSKKMSGRFVLLAKEWNGGTGKVTYDDQVWRTSSESAYASLLVDLKKANNTSVKKKTVSGRKVRG